MIWWYSIGAVVIVSLISFVGAFSLFLTKDRLQKWLLALVSFSVGALLGDVFLHMIPEMAQDRGFPWQTGSYILLGLILFFVVEKFVHWHHCHQADHDHKIKPSAYTNLIGDGLHNFLDGLIIAASFLVSGPLGMATTLAVVLHEIPQEMGDFGVMLHAGLKPKRALWFNFFSALLAIVGAVVGLLLYQQINGVQNILLALAAGGFIYLAGSDLIPELHQERRAKQSIIQLLLILAGIGVLGLMRLISS